MLPDSVIAREKSEILVEYLHKVFCERGGMNLKIELQFEEAQESKYRKNAVLQLSLIHICPSSVVYAFIPSKTV